MLSSRPPRRGSAAVGSTPRSPRRARDERRVPDRVGGGQQHQPLRGVRHAPIRRRVLVLDPAWADRPRPGARSRRPVRPGSSPRGSSSRASGLPRVSSMIRSRTRSSSRPGMTDGQQRPRVVVLQPSDRQFRQPASSRRRSARERRTPARPTRPAGGGRRSREPGRRPGRAIARRRPHTAAAASPTSSAIRLSAARATRNRSGLSPAASPKATRSARRCGSASEPSRASIGAHSWCRPAKASSISDSTPDRTGHREPRGLPDQVAQQLRLADPGLAPQHQDGALAAAHVRDEPPQGLLLAGPAEQRGRGPLDRHRPCHPVFSTAAEHSQLTLTAAAGLPQWGKPVFPAGQTELCPPQVLYASGSGLDLAAQRLQRGDVDLGEGGERLDDVAQHVERHAGADGQRGLLQPLAGLGAERVGAGQPLAVAQQGQEARWTRRRRGCRSPSWPPRTAGRSR